METEMRQSKAQGLASKSEFTENSKTQSDIRKVSDLAGKTILLEIAMRLNILPFLLSERRFSLEELFSATDLPRKKLMSFLSALISTGLVESGEETQPIERRKYAVTDEFLQLKTVAGYLAWTHGACRPLIDNAEVFLREPDRARKRFVRDGRLVAVSTEWMGETGFYVPILQIVEKLRPRKVVDLGCGSGRFLRETLGRFPAATGIGIDMDINACREAERNTPPGIEGRVEFLHQRIEELCSDASCLEGADLISASFVLHDLMPHAEEILDDLLKTCSRVLSGGTMAITELAPYEKEAGRRTFSTVVTLIHELFMFRKVMNKEEWEAKLLKNGFKSVEFVTIPFPAGMVMLAR